MTGNLEILNSFVWNYIVLCLSLFCGIFFSIRCRNIQIRAFQSAISAFRNRKKEKSDNGQISPFQALTASLSGTVGVGNISGIAIAISVGGPGAVFWMWVAAFLGVDGHQKVKQNGHRKSQARI